MSAQNIIKNLTMITQVKEFKDGMPAMVECFATWCPPCKAAIPHLAEMHSKYEHVYIVSISREAREKVEALKKNLPMMSKYNLAVDTTGNLDKYMEEQGVEGIPHAFLFNQAGELVWQGHPMDAECATELEKLNK